MSTRWLLCMMFSFVIMQAGDVGSFCFEKSKVQYVGGLSELVVDNHTRNIARVCVGTWHRLQEWGEEERFSLPVVVASYQKVMHERKKKG